MPLPFLPTLDQAVLTASLREALDRFNKILSDLGSTPAVPVPNADWLELYDVLDRVKEHSETVLRPAPPELVAAYRRTWTWIREIHGRLVREPEDRYGRRQLETLSARLNRDLIQFGSP